MRILFSLFMFMCFSFNAYAQEAEVTFIRTLSKHELNKVLGEDRLKFLPETAKSYVFPKIFKAKYDVDIYKVTYPSVIPDLNRKSTMASGLIAIPKVDNAISLPFISYQHGTVYGKYEVPSYSFMGNNPSDYLYEGAYETRLMVAQYAAQGYVVMAADYFGMGDSPEPEAFMVKHSVQQACADLYDVAVHFLAKNGIQQKNLFLAGWSEGGWATTALLQKLENRGTAIKAVFTASSPSDLFAAMNGWAYNPRKIDAVWENTILALMVFSYENYYAKPGFASEVINPKYYELFRKLYQRDYKDSAEMEQVKKLLESAEPFKDYLSHDYADSGYLADSEFGKLLQQNESYRQIFKTPVKMYYGTHDEVIAVPVGKLASIYQKSLGSKSISAISVEGGNHRGTFLSAVSESKKWFDELSK